jgi:hypothetical protein
MNPSAFSPDGYIIDQRYTDAAKYGARTSDTNGCGWIAAYNFLHAVGVQTDWRRIAEDMECGSLFRCTLGTSPFRLLRYLRRRGYKLRQAWGRDAVIQLADQSNTGILFYRHTRGPHFVAFTREENGQLRFFNAVLGDARHVIGIEAFINGYAKKWPIWVIGVI